MVQFHEASPVRCMVWRSLSVGGAHPTWLKSRYHPTTLREGRGAFCRVPLHAMVRQASFIETDPIFLDPSELA
jgi:hypothetical protein